MAGQLGGLVRPLDWCRGRSRLSFRPATTRWEFIDAAVLYTSIGVGAIVAAGWKAAFARREFDKSQALAEAADQLATANDELRGAQREKTRLFHNISHELRTPLTTILAPLDDLVNGGPYRKDDVKMMRRNARRLLRLVDDILELSKLDGGGIKLQVGRVNVSELVDGASRMLAPGAAARDIELTYRGPDEPVYAYADAYRVETILVNLIGNAVKYTPQGGQIDVSLEVHEARLRVSVKDTGPGVPENMRDRIFERYVQVGDKALGGVGIGLALARELVELHGGDRGSSPRRRWVHLLVHAADRRAPRPCRYERLASSVTRALAKVRRGRHRRKASRPCGWDGPRRRRRARHSKGHCRHSPQALECHRGGRRCSGARADSQGETRCRPCGHDDASHGRGRDASRSPGDPKIAHTPVIVLTAAGGADWETAILASGADDYLSKPFSPKVLLARVRLQMRIRGLVAGLANQEKLAAIGTLTAGILHEVNNPAGCIVAMSTLIRPETAPAKLQVVQDTIRSWADRIVKLTAALRSHARPDEHDTAKPFNLKEGIESSMALLAYAIHGRTDVSNRMPAGARSLRSSCLDEPRVPQSRGERF